MNNECNTTEHNHKDFSCALNNFQTSYLNRKNAKFMVKVFNSIVYVTVTKKALKWAITMGRITHVTGHMNEFMAPNVVYIESLT